MAEYTYTIDPVRLDAFEQEIEDAGISSGLDGTIVVGDQVTVFFTSSLSTGDEATLAAVAANHTAPASKPGSDAVCIKDGVDEPAATVGGVCIYVDVNDGNLKVKFGDGHVVTLALDE